MTEGDSAQARKRRKAIRSGKEEESNQQKMVAAASAAESSVGENESVEEQAAVPLEKRTIESSADGKKKTQIRYDPSVPMSKEQLAAWRREARRVRNRQSAAASREKIRNRIQELEDEANEWKLKYEEAAQRLKELESMTKGEKNAEGETNQQREAAL